MSPIKTSEIPRPSCENIFDISGHHPEKTYIQRGDFAEQLIDSIKANQIALVYGVSKCGKTLLAKYVLNQIGMPQVWVYGNQINTDEGLWGVIAEGLDLSKTYSKKRKTYAQIEIANRLVSDKICLVIDDFHYISTQELRLQTLRTLKMLNGESIPIIIIGVQSPQIREIEWLQDMMGRIKAIEISPWSETELIYIANKGFSSRGTAVMQLARLAQESFGSPFLMQFLCQLYCKQRLEKHLGSKIGYVERVEPEDLDIIFPKAAKSFSYKHIYSILTHPSSCVNDHLYHRHDGRKGNLNQMLWYAISGIYPKGAIPYLSVHISQLWHRMGQILDSSEVITDELLFSGLSLMVNRYLEYCESSYDSLTLHDPIIDMVGQVFYVRDPFILFYLRNSQEVETQFAF